MVLKRLSAHYNVLITISGPDDESSKEFLRSINDAVQRNVAGILVNGTGDAEEARVINNAIDNNIPVVTIDGLVPGSRCPAHFGTDWYRMGRIIADRVAEACDKPGDIFVITPENETHNSCISVFKNEIERHPDLKLLSIDDATSTYNKSEHSIPEAVIRENSNLKAIVVLDRNRSHLAASALKKSGRSEDVLLFCLDYGRSALEYIRDGVINELYMENREAFTCLAFQYLYALNHEGGFSVEGNLDAGFVVITPGNVDTYSEMLDIERFLEIDDRSREISLLAGMIESTNQLALAADRQGRVIYANDECLQLTGLSREEISRTSIYNLFSFNSREIGEVTNAAQGRSGACLGSTIRTSSGDEVKCQLGISPFISHNKGAGVSVIAMNISSVLEEKDTLEQKVEELDKALAINRDYLSHVSHELRNPVRSMLEAISEVMSEKPEDFPEEYSIAAENISRHARILERIADDLLQVSKKELGAMRVDVKPVPVDEILDSIIESHGQIKHRKSVRIERNGESIKVDADPDRLKQVVSDLVDNSIRYSSKAVEIVITTDIDGDFGTITVEDNGVGIPPEKLPRIFERFFRVDDADSSVKDGAGLGLAISRDLVRMMNGDITVSSKPGVGSEFTIELPLTGKQVKKILPCEEVLETDETHSDMQTVLVIDDDPVTLELTRVMLKERFNVLLASSGENGFELLDKNEVDIILLDWIMPDMDGIHVLKGLKQSSRRDIPVILLSGETDRETAQRGLQKGAVDFITKPYNKADLIMRMEKALEG